jgi:hypothetical protein
MITLITHSDKRPDFIELQYKSIQKHLKNNFEYIVLNNDITKGQNYNNIHEICNRLSIKCVDVELDESLQTTNGSLNYSNNQYTTGNNACVYSLFWTFKNFVKNQEIVIVIDSDMFFIHDINIEELMVDRDIIFTPHYRTSNNTTVDYIWPGFVCLNLKKSPHLKDLNWNHGLGGGVINGVVTDVGGFTYYNIIEHDLHSNPLYVYEHAIYDDIHIDSLGNKFIHYQLNGCVNYMITLDERNRIIKNNHIGGWKISQNKSFPHEPDTQDYWGDTSDKINRILNILNENEVNLPSPVRVSFLEISNILFILHYQGGSNYSSISTFDYNLKKTTEIKKILDNSVSAPTISEQ